MALDTGKKVVSLNNNKTESNYIKPRTSLGTIAKGFEGVMETYTQIAASNHESSWTNDFKQKLFEKKLELKEKHKMDPASMRASTEAYSKALLENVPKLYEGTATALLALNNNNLIEHATNNKITDDNDKAVAGHTENLKIDNANISEFHQNTVNNELFNQDQKHSKINNNTFDNAYALINENAHNSQVNLVNNNLKYQKAHDEEVVAQIVNTEESRLLHIGMSFDNEGEFLLHMQKFLDGKDTFQDLESKNEAFGIYKKHIKDRDVREEIYNDVLSKYQTWRGDKLKSLVTHNKFDLSSAKELGGTLHFTQFSNGQNSNAEKYIIDNYPNVSATDSLKIKKHINGVYKTQANVVKIKNGEILTGLTKAEENDAFEQLLSEFAINQDPSKILDVTDPNFQVIKTIFEKNGSIPESWNTYLKKPTGDLAQPEVMEGFKKQLEFYNQIKGEFSGFHTDVDTSSFMFYASENNLLELSDGEIAQAALNFNRKDKKEISFSVDSQISNDVAAYETSINNALDGKKGLFSTWSPFRKSVSRDLSLSTIFGDGNKFSKVLYPDSWTLFADGPWDLMEDGVKADFKVAVANELKFMASGASVDITNQKTIELATFSALNKLLKTNYTPSKFTEKKGYQLTKHGIENEFNLSDTATIFSVLPTMDAWWATLSQSEKDAGAFGLDENGANIKYEDIQARMKDGELFPAFKPTGLMVNGKMSYTVSVPNGNGQFVKITLPGENFQPGGWENVDKEDAPSHKGEVLKVLADENHSFMEELLGDFSTTEPTTKLLLRKFAHSGEQGLINLANWSWMVDVPIIDDVPNEIKPFKMLFNLLGKDVPDLDDKMSKIAIHNKKQADLMTYEQKINNNKLLNNKSKHLESLYPPHKQVHGSYRSGMMFSHYAYSNYNNTELALTHRTNNFLGLEKNTNDNSLDITAENNTAVFAHPKDSIKAAIIKMVDMSSIVPGDNKIFGDTPTIEKLLTEFNPKDKDLYLKALKNSKLIPEDIVNFQDTNQMAAIIKFMSRVKMGTKSQPIQGDTSIFDNYYKGNIMLDIYINEGVTEAFNTYAGSIGKK
jgi:hypothetical protein